MAPRLSTKGRELEPWADRRFPVGFPSVSRRFPVGFLGCAGRLSRCSSPGVLFSELSLGGSAVQVVGPQRGEGVRKPAFPKILIRCISAVGASLPSYSGLYGGPGNAAKATVVILVCVFSLHFFRAPPPARSAFGAPRLSPDASSPQPSARARTSMRRRRRRRRRRQRSTSREGPHENAYSYHGRNFVEFVGIR